VTLNDLNGHFTLNSVALRKYVQNFFAWTVDFESNCVKRMKLDRYCQPPKYSARTSFYSDIRFMRIFLRVLQIFMKISVRPTYTCLRKNNHNDIKCRYGYFSEILQTASLYYDMGNSRLEGKGLAVPKSSDECEN